MKVAGDGGGHRGDEEDEDERHHEGEIDAPERRDDEDQGGQRGVERHQVAHDAKEQVLQMADGSGRPNQLGGLAVEGPGPRGGDIRRGFPPSNDGARVEGRANRPRHRFRFPCDGGLVDLYIAIHERAVRGNDVPDPQVDAVSGHQLPRRHRGPGPIPEYPCGDVQAVPQELQRRARPPLLDLREQGIEYQEREDNRGLRILLQEQLDRQGRLQHPGDGTPEPPRELDQGARGLLPVLRSARSGPVGPGPPVRSALDSWQRHRPSLRAPLPRSAVGTADFKLKWLLGNPRSPAHRRPGNRAQPRSHRPRRLELPSPKPDTTTLTNSRIPTFRTEVPWNRPGGSPSEWRDLLP